jgi:glutamine amidotransferase
VTGKPRVVILDYGMGNLRSVARAVERTGGEPVVTADPSEAAAGDALVVPGVGAFGACMAGLTHAGLDRVVVEAATGNRPVLGVCLGMQVLYGASEESPGVAGLGLLRGTVRRLPATARVPHMGWNEVRWVSPHPLTAGIDDGARFYFVHSYAADPQPGVAVGVTEHGREVAAAIARGNVFATQFHPEKSGDAGLQIYANLVAETRAA